MSTKKPKRKNSEKRKQKSRDAARCRRGKETEVFADLSSELPVPCSTKEQMDKATIMRLAITHLKLRTLIRAGAWDLVKSEDPDTDALFLDSLDAFLMVLDDLGDVIYASDATTKYLGISQYDMMGQSLYEFTHPCDHEEIRGTLADASSGKHDGKSHAFSVRMKSTITSKGRSINIKSAAYKVMQCSGRSLELKRDACAPDRSYLSVICSPVPHPSNIEQPLDSSTFLTRHKLDMSFTYCDNRLVELLGFNESEMLGQSFYNYIHAADAPKLATCFKDLFDKDQCVTGLYRLMVANGGHVWLDSQATVIYNSRTDKPECVVCLHFIVSGVECSGAILSSSQMTTAHPALAACPVAETDQKKNAFTLDSSKHLCVPTQEVYKPPTNQQLVPTQEAYTPQQPSVKQSMHSIRAKRAHQASQEGAVAQKKRCLSLAAQEAWRKETSPEPERCTLAKILTSPGTASSCSPSPGSADVSRMTVYSPAPSAAGSPMSTEPRCSPHNPISPMENLSLLSPQQKQSPARSLFPSSWDSQPKYQGEKQQFATDSIFKPTAVPNKPHNSFSGVTESMFQPRTASMEKEDIFSETSRVHEEFSETAGEQIDDRAPAMEGGPDAGGMPGSFLDDVLFGTLDDDPIVTSDPVMPFMGAPYQDSDTESLICSSERMSRQSTPDRMMSLTPQPPWTEIDDQLDNLDQRAPFISMQDGDDLLFSAIPVFLNDGSFSNMMGTTETIFADNPNPKLQPIVPPMSVLKSHEIANLMSKHFLPNGDVVRNAGPPKTKQPLEMNQLETGPPVAQPSCALTTHMAPPATTASVSWSSSVLKNLLTSGRDDTTGYMIPSTAPAQQPPPAAITAPSAPQLSQPPAAPIMQVDNRSCNVTSRSYNATSRSCNRFIPYPVKKTIRQLLAESGSASTPANNRAPNSSGSGLIILPNSLGIPAENASQLLQQISYQMADNKEKSVLLPSAPTSPVACSNVSSVAGVAPGFVDGIIDDASLLEGLTQSDIESNFKKVPSECLLQGQDILSALDC